MSKGFVIAVDALLSLAILFVIITLAFDASSSARNNFQQEKSLFLFAENAALTFEQTRLLSDAVILNNTTRVRSAINGWPSAICGSVSVYDSPDENVPVFSVTKTGCALQTVQLERVRHGFMVASPPDVNLYVMEVAAWPGSP
jgi:hypothetical protein